MLPPGTIQIDESFGGVSRPFLAWIIGSPCLRHRVHGASIRVRGETPGSQNYRSVGESQSVRLMIDLMISRRTRP
jgi:hypothetical protein